MYAGASIAFSRASFARTLLPIHIFIQAKFIAFVDADSRLSIYAKKKKVFNVNNFDLDENDDYFYYKIIVLIKKIFGEKMRIII